MSMWAIIIGRNGIKDGNQIKMMMYACKEYLKKLVYSFAVRLSLSLSDSDYSHVPTPNQVKVK